MDVKFIIKIVVLALLLGGVVALVGTSLPEVVVYWTEFIGFLGSLLYVAGVRLGGIVSKVIACAPLLKFIVVVFCLGMLRLLVKWLFTGRSSEA